MHVFFDFRLKAAGSARTNPRGGSGGGSGACEEKRTHELPAPGLESTVGTNVLALEAATDADEPAAIVHFVHNYMLLCDFLWRLRARLENQVCWQWITPDFNGRLCARDRVGTGWPT